MNDVVKKDGVFVVCLSFPVRKCVLYISVSVVPEPRHMIAFRVFHMARLNMQNPRVFAINLCVVKYDLFLDSTRYDGPKSCKILESGRLDIRAVIPEVRKILQTSN